MTYTLGPSHIGLTGRGSFSVARPAGLRLVTTTVPSYVGHDAFTPPRQFRLGRVAYGNLEGFWNSHAVEFLQQVIYPLPDQCDIVAYDIVAGAHLTIVELVGAVTPLSVEPWDRNPTPFNQLAFANPTGGGGIVTMWSYTVPTGRRLLLSSARAQMIRRIAATNPNYTAAWIELNGSYFVWLQTSHQTIGSQHTAEMQAGPVVLSAGHTLVAKYVIDEAGGSLYTSIAAAGTLFDA